MADDAGAAPAVKKPVKPAAKPGAKPAAKPAVRPASAPAVKPAVPAGPKAAAKPAPPSKSKPPAKAAPAPAAKPPPLAKPARKAKAGAEQPKEVVDPKVRNARVAAAAVVFAVAGVEFAIGVLATGIIVNALWILLGVVSVGTGAYLFAGRFSAWGVAVILGALAILLILPAWGWFLSWILIGVLVASFVVLYLVRVPFGVGAWKIEATAQDKETRGMIEARTKNAANLRCPKCGNERMWIADDGSAFCLACRAGTIELGVRSPRSL